MKNPDRHRIGGLILLGVVVAALCALRLLIDRAPGGGLGLAWPDPDYAEFRFRSAAVAVVIGASLAVSGVLLQALLRNPLASPFILGVSSGAGLGVMVWMYLGYILGISQGSHGTGGGFRFAGFVASVSQTAAALGGAIVILALVYLLAQRRRILDPLSLVLVGVVLAAMCNAGMMILELLVPNRLRGDLLFWMMGNIRQNVGDGALLTAGVICLVGVVVAALMGRAMDAATFGDDEARSVGLNLGPLRVLMFLLAGVLAASAVAIAGPIGFVGLIAPHAARLLVGPAHTTLVLAAAITGAGLVVAADAASQALDFGAGRVPVGVFTALIGGPAFLWLLRTGRGQV